MKTAVLQPIGKGGQYTIPKQWRKDLGIEKKPLIAEYRDGAIILRPQSEVLEWDIECISWDNLSAEDLALVKASRGAYEKGEWNKFISFEQAFSDDKAFDDV